MKKLNIDNPIVACVVFVPTTLGHKQGNFATREDADVWVTKQVRNGQSQGATKYSVYLGEYTEAMYYELVWNQTKAEVAKAIAHSKAKAIEL